MHRWHSAWLGAALLLAAPALAQQAPQQKLSTTLSTLNATKTNEARLKKELQATESDMQTMRARATDLAASLQQSEQRASRAEGNLSSLTRELEVTEKEFALRKREYTHTVMSMLRMRQMPATAMFARPEDMQTILRTSRVMQNTNSALNSRAQKLQQEITRISTLRRNVASTTEQVRRERASLAQKQTQLKADLATRQRLQEKLSRDHANARAEVSRLSRESASLQELIGKLEHARNQPQFASRTAEPGGAMAKARGHLRLPVEGKLVHRFGERRNANETYRGIVLAPRAGATVVTPYQGEVVFTGPFMNYGRMVLLKHSDGFITLLAGLGNIAVSLNQQLAKGEPIGSMGASNPQLYVEVRDHSKPIDPTRWFANLPSGLAQRR